MWAGLMPTPGAAEGAPVDSAAERDALLLIRLSDPDAVLTRVVRELHDDGGFSVAAIRKGAGAQRDAVDAALLQTIDVAALRAGGFTAQDMQSAGRSLRELRTAFDDSELLEAGYGPDDLVG